MNACSFYLGSITHSIEQTHLIDVVEHLDPNDYENLNSQLLDSKFTYAVIDKAITGANIPVNTLAEETNVFRAWKRQGNATRQKIIDALGKARKHRTKKKLETKWGTTIGNIKQFFLHFIIFLLQRVTLL